MTRFGVLIFLGALILPLFSASEEVFAAQLAKDAYMPPVKLNAKYMGRYKVRSYEYHGVRFFKLHGKKSDYVVFRGSDNTANWLTNLSVAETPYISVSGAKVHAGFYEIAQAAVERLHLGKEANIVVCGHSLGGAVALLTGAMLHEEGYDVEVVTFGAPPVGNEAFTEAFDSLPHLRFEHLFDLVPKADKKSIASLKGLIEQIDTDAIGYESLKNAVIYLKTMPYGFVQHGEGRLLTHILGMDNPLSEELFSQPLRYHMMDSYLLGFEEEMQEE